MSKYCIWHRKNDDDSVIIVQVFNKCDLADVQKEFIEKGYIIERLAHIGNDAGFIAGLKELYI